MAAQRRCQWAAIADPRQPRVVSAPANVTMVPAHIESVQVDDWHAAGPEA
jgi:hypothetical protein